MDRHDIPDEWVERYDSWRAETKAQLDSGGCSIHSFMTARLSFLGTPQMRWAVRQYWELYAGNHAILATWVSQYLDLPAEWPAQRQRYWRTLCHLRAEQAAGHVGLLVETLKAAGQDWDAAQVARLDPMKPDPIEWLEAQGPAIKKAEATDALSQHPIVRGPEGGRG